MIVQHPNGNSYLFIDNRVFVSAYNETTKSVISVKLDLSLPLNDWEKEQIKLHIGDILPDGYIYKVVIHSYGSHDCISYNNLKNALDCANEYNEDNGFADLYTNNPNVDTVLSGGTVYYLEDFDKLVYPYNNHDCKVLCNSYSTLAYMKNIDKEEAQSQLNGLENQTYE
ncbi:MAG: hypothetical protein WCO04_01475 [Pseudomonadota bacterium]|jgi:hypothetical protein